MTSVEWTEQDMRLLDVLMETAALELVSRRAMDSVWAMRAADRAEAGLESGDGPQASGTAGLQLIE